VHPHRADVLIIGAGLAGLVTALELLSAGRRVTLVDRDGPERLGGLARESFGGLFLVDTPEQRRAGIRDGAALAWRDWRSFGELADEDAPADWSVRWAHAQIEDAAGPLRAWLTGHGLRFLPMPLWVERGWHGEGNSVPRWHVVWGTGRRLTERLAAALLGHPRRAALTLLFRHRVDGLRRTGGRVDGCFGRTEPEGRPFELEADAVVVASGGINGDLDRVRAVWPDEAGPAPAALLNGAHPFADGRLHDAVSGLGGAIAPLGRMWNYAAGIRHWQPRKPDHGLSLVPPRSALWLDERGGRIGPPPLVGSFDTLDLVTRICRAGSGESWLLLNRRIARRELAISGAEFNPAIAGRAPLRLLREMVFGNDTLVDTVCAHCPDVVSAPDLDTLIGRMNAAPFPGTVDAARLRAVVAAYDAEIARGSNLFNDEQLRRLLHLRRWRGDRLRIARPAPLLDPAGGPLIAIRAQIVSRKSLGGIRTDLACRAVTPAGAVIPGLYAVGEAAGFGGGGVHGRRSLEGTFLGGCLHTARRAARALSS